MTLIYGLHLLLGGMIKLLVLPLAGLHPVWSLIAISAATGLVMVWLFGLVSNQAAIRVVKNRIFGNLIGVRLFQDDIGVMLRLQGRILLDTLVYMRHSLIPLLVMIVPVILIMIHMNRYYGMRPLRPGEAAVVTAGVRSGDFLERDLALETGEGVAVETPPVRIPALREVSWRVRAEAHGAHELVVRVGEARAEKRLVAGETWGAVTALRTGRSLTELLLYPGEPPIPADSTIEVVKIAYPPLPMTLFGWNVHWIVLFFVFSIVFGYAFKGPLGVEV